VECGPSDKDCRTFRQLRRCKQGSHVELQTLISIPQQNLQFYSNLDVSDLGDKFIINF